MGFLNCPSYYYAHIKLRFRVVGDNSVTQKGPEAAGEEAGSITTNEEKMLQVM